MDEEREEASRRARAAYEAALAAYEGVRFGRAQRSKEWAAARELDEAQAAYFRLGPDRPSVAQARAAGWRLGWGRPSFDVHPSRLVAAAIEPVLALVFVLGVGLPVGYMLFLRPETQPAVPALSATRLPAARAIAPTLRFVPEPGPRALSRFLDINFASDQALQAASLSLVPDPGITCEARLATGYSGRIRCLGPLPGGQDFVARLQVTSLFGGVTTRVPYAFRTQQKLNQLEGVKWFTEFEDPSAEPLACAAASIRIIHVYTTGQDPMSAEQILRWGRQFNRSRDPGLDPAAIATVLKRLDGRNNYHYYVHSSREEATKAAVYWMLRSGKPVIAITLGGQHAPVIVGYTGEFADRYDDPANRITGIIVMDPQRGDLDPRTARFRLDKDRSLEYQTGRTTSLIEWYGDEWWFAAPYWSSLNGVSMDRSDGVYASPHWTGNYVIIVDDGDAEHPSDQPGRRAVE